MLQKTQFPKSIIVSIIDMKKLKCIYVILYWVRDIVHLFNLKNTHQYCKIIHINSKTG